MSNLSSGNNSGPRLRRLAFHAVSAGIMINGFNALQGIAIMKDITPEYGGMLQYLTILGLMATAITMGVSGIQDLIPSLPGLGGIKRGLLLFALPVEITIASIYWPIIFLMPELMIPQGPVAGSEPTSAPSGGGGGQMMRIPLWIDLSLHAVPAIALIFDFFINEKKYLPPVSNRLSPFVAASFGIAYVAWVEYCAAHNGGTFPYPFLTIASPTQRGAIYVVATGFAWLVFRGLNWLHR